MIVISGVKTCAGKAALGSLMQGRYGMYHQDLISIVAK
jgi:hypothetical protein